MFKKVAGMQRVSPGWTRVRIEPGIGAEFTQASAPHATPRGLISCMWNTITGKDGFEILQLKISAPYGTIVEIVYPQAQGYSEPKEVVGPGECHLNQPSRGDMSGQLYL